MSPQPAISPRGLVLLTAAAAVGLVLAIHGWSSHEKSGLPGALTRSASATAGASASARPDSTPTAGPRASAPPAPSPSSHASVGPLLKTQSFAQYSFRVWPGVPSAAAKAAMTGLSVSVTRHVNGLLVRAGVAGQPAGKAAFYAGGARVYVVEATMGDDSNATDYSLGDDALVVTDLAGRIVQ